MLKYKKDPCKCSEHECKQMLFQNEVLRRSLKKALLKIADMKKAMGLLDEPAPVSEPKGAENEDGKGGGGK